MSGPFIEVQGKQDAHQIVHETLHNKGAHATAAEPVLLHTVPSHNSMGFAACLMRNQKLPSYKVPDAVDLLFKPARA